MSTCTADDVKKYRELLLEVGLPVELKGARVSELLCKKLTDSSSTNPHLTDELRNLYEHAFFHSDKTYLFVIPPDRQIVIQTSSVLFAEAMRAEGKTREFFHDALFDLHRAHSERFGRESDIPHGGTMRVLSGLSEGGFEPKRAVRLPVDYFHSPITAEEGDGGKIRKQGDSLASIGEGVAHAFEHDGVLYTATGFAFGFKKNGKNYANYVNGHVLVPKSEWKKKVLTKQADFYRLWDQKKMLRGDLAGFLVKVKGKPYVIAESVNLIPDVPELAW